MKRNNIILKKALLVIIFISMIVSCRHYENKDFCGEWYYNKTKFIFHENGNLEIYNLDKVFWEWTDSIPKPLNYYKGTWSINSLDGYQRIEMDFAKCAMNSFFIENDCELYYFIGDPDLYNRINIYKK